MRVGIFAPLVNPYHTPEYITALAQGAEERDFHVIWLGEHVVLFDEYASRYPYANDSRIPIASDSGLMDPFPTLGFLASASKRIRLGTAVCLVPQRNPVYTAKEVATADYLSGGRIEFGVGVGWLAEEFAALQVPWARRGARTREYLEVIRRLWTEPVASYEGEFYTLPPCRQYPKPVQKPHPPINFGGESEAALKRVAEFGDGWHPFNCKPEDLAAGVARLEVLLAEHGRSRADITIAVCPYSHPIDGDLMARYRDAGADQLSLMVATGSVRKLTAILDELAEDYVEPAKGL